MNYLTKFVEDFHNTCAFSVVEIFMIISLISRFNFFDEIGSISSTHQRVHLHKFSSKNSYIYPSTWTVHLFSKEKIVLFKVGLHTYINVYITIMRTLRNKNLIKCAYLLSLSTKSGPSAYGEVEHRSRISVSENCRIVKAIRNCCLVLSIEMIPLP